VVIAIFKTAGNATFRISIRLIAPFHLIFASGNSTDFGSEGSNGDYTCVLPKEPAGCPYDNPHPATTTTHHHTAAYLAGFNQEKGDIQQNGGPETPVDMCQSMDFAGKDLTHGIVGANDAINGVRP